MRTSPYHPKQKVNFFLWDILLRFNEGHRQFHFGTGPGMALIISWSRRGLMVRTSSIVALSHLKKVGRPCHVVIVDLENFVDFFASNNLS